MNERQLLEPASGGDEDAFARWWSPTDAHCHRMLGSGRDAEDALQDTLLRAWRGLARFEGAKLAALGLCGLRAPRDGTGRTV